MLNIWFMGGAATQRRTRGVVGGAYKLFDIVSLEMTLNESIGVLL